jgi:hypothetical protein
MYLVSKGMIMTTIALRVPTALPEQPSLSNGQCYILLPSGPIQVRDLIAEKVRAELRKARMGGLVASSLPLLMPDSVPASFGPLDEQLAIAQACRAFTEGRFLLLCDGRPLVDLQESVVLSRQTTLLFLHVPTDMFREVAPALKGAA